MPRTLKVSLEMRDQRAGGDISKIEDRISRAQSKEAQTHTRVAGMRSVFYVRSATFITGQICSGDVKMRLPAECMLQALH